MTFEQFQTTRKECGNLAEAVQSAPWGDDPLRPPTGYLYLGCLYIEHVEPHWPVDAVAQGKFYLLLDRREWISNDLTELELQLYAWAASEGYFEENDDTQRMISEYEAWNKSNNLNLGSADEHVCDDSLTDHQRLWLRAFSSRWEQAASREDNEWRRRQS